MNQSANAGNGMANGTTNPYGCTVLFNAGAVGVDSGTTTGTSPNLLIFRVEGNK